MPQQDRETLCPFCGKHRVRVASVAALLAESAGKPSESAAICVECLSLCEEILDEELG